MSEEMEVVVSLLIPTLTTQRSMIEGASGGMPRQAYDDYALGYLVGLCDGVVQGHQLRNCPFPQVVMWACYIAFGDGRKIGDTEERLLKRISELANSQPSDYVNGKQAAFNGYLKSLNLPMFLPDMGWFNYVRETRKRIKNFDGAVEALANFKKCTPASATLIVQETIDKFTAATLKKGCDSFLAKAVAEEEAFEELAQLIYGRDASQ